MTPDQTLENPKNLTRSLGFCFSGKVISTKGNAMKVIGHCLLVIFTGGLWGLFLVVRALTR